MSSHYQCSLINSNITNGKLFSSANGKTYEFNKETLIIKLGNIDGPIKIDTEHDYSTIVTVNSTFEFRIEDPILNILYSDNCSLTIYKDVSEFIFILINDGKIITFTWEIDKNVSIDIQRKIYQRRVRGWLICS